MRLYEINEAIEDLIDIETGELLDIDKFLELQLAKEELLINMIKWYKNQVALSAGIKTEINQLKELQNKTDMKSERIKNHIVTILEGQKHSSPAGEVTYRTSKTVVINEVGKIPIDYMEFKTTEVPNKILIKKAIEEGFEIPGATLETRQNVTIK